jgi:hypothetical protein
VVSALPRRLGGRCGAGEGLAQGLDEEGIAIQMEPFRVTFQIAHDDPLDWFQLDP